MKAGTIVQVLGSEREWLRVRVPGVQQEGFVLAADVELITGTSTSASGTATGQVRPRVGVHAVLSFGQTSLTSAQSFDAVAGQHTKTTFGVGAEVVNLWKGLFAGAAYSPLSLDGEQVFVDGGSAEPSGIPVTTSVNSLDVVGGWRFTFRRPKPAPPKPGQKPPTKKSLAQTKGAAAAAETAAGEGGAAAVHCAAFCPVRRRGTLHGDVQGVQFRSGER